MAITKAKLSYIDGITSSTAELNILDGVTSNASELNYLDGIAGVVASTASTGSSIIPSGTTAQRDGSPAVGYLRFNTEEASFEGYDGSSWAAVGGGINNQKLDDISSGFDSANTSFTLAVSSSAVSPASVNNVLISLNGVIQEPTTTYTISGSTITFTTAPDAGDTFFGLYYGTLSVGVPGDGSVGTAQLSSANIAFDTSTLFIDSTNNRVGVGTITPSAPLTIQGGSTTNATIQLNGGAVGNDNASIHSLYNLNFKADSSESIAGRSIGFAVGSTTAMRVVSGGKVGIGTNSPLGKLTISNDAGATAPTTVTAANAYLQLGSDDYGLSGAGKFMIGFGYTDATNTNSPAYIGFEESTSSGDTKGSLTFYTRDVITDTAPSERMRILSGGGVAIGTSSSPNNAPLLIHCATDDNLRFKQETHASIQAVNDAANAFVELKLDGSSLFLNSQSGGNVGIGTNAPVEGNLVVRNDSGDSKINIKVNSFAGTNGIAALDFSTGGQGSNDPQARIHAIGQNNYSADLVFSTQISGTTNPLSERMRILSGGGLTFNGDTATANALDDYEEGTFNASITFGGNTPTGISYSMNAGSYTKVGRVVHCTFGMNASWSSSTGGGDLRINGLPFTEGRGGGYVEPGFAIGNKGLSSFTHAAVGASSTQLICYKNDSTSSYVGNDFNSGGASGFWFHGTLTYMTT